MSLAATFLSTTQPKLNRSCLDSEPPTRLPNLSIHALPPDHSLLVQFPQILPILIRHTNFRDLIAHLAPHVASGRHRTDPAQPPVHDARDQKPHEEVQVVDPLRRRGDVSPHRARETDYVDEDAGDVGRVPAPVEAESEVIRPRLAPAVEVFDLQVAAADEVVVTDHHARDGGQEHRVRRQIRREAIRILEQVPRTHDQPHCCADVGAAADGDPPREQGGHVRACGDGVGGDVGAELGEGEGGCDGEDAEALRRPAFFQEGFQQVERVPDGVAAEDDRRAGGHDDADEAGDREADGDGAELGEEGVGGFAREAGEVRVVDDEGCEVCDRGHDPADHQPGEC